MRFQVDAHKGSAHFPLVTYRLFLAHDMNFLFFIDDLQDSELKHGYFLRRQESYNFWRA